jgi:hypothetical protein
MSGLPATSRPSIHHFVALGSFEGRIADSEVPSPHVWVLPIPEMGQFKRSYGTRTNVSRGAIHAQGDEFENAWRLIAGTES